MPDSIASSSDPDVLIEARDICKSFPGVRALDNAQLTIRRGRLNALLGENGAGKSTLMNILSGVFPPDSGTILLNGKSVTFRRPHEAQQTGIATIYQELNLVPELSVAENIFLGREPLNRAGFIDYHAMHGRSSTLLVQLGLNINPRTRVSRLRVGAQQVVEIVKAVSSDAQVLIMDEPTSAISDQEIELFFGLIRQLKQRGVGIVYITHKLDELNRIADDITVFRDGQFIAEKPFHGMTHDDTVRMMVGRDVAQVNRQSSTIGPEVLRIHNISLPHPGRAGDYAINHVSFTVHRGEIVGLFGLMGAGRTELLHTLFGLHPRSSGDVFVGGRRIENDSPSDSIRAGIALAPEDRKVEGLVLPMSVAENVSLSCLERASRLGVLDVYKERRLASSFVDRLKIKTSSLRQRVRNLSGGNQQKVVISKWLAASPKVLLLDEPTRGIDVNAKREMYALIDELARDGLAIVMASSELPEILTLADRILVLADGLVTAEFSRGEATEEKLLAAALPKCRAREAASA